MTSLGDRLPPEQWAKLYKSLNEVREANGLAPIAEDEPESEDGDPA